MNSINLILNLEKDLRKINNELLEAIDKNDKSTAQVLIWQGNLILDKISKTIG